ncbi:type II toxin-antitoxin system Phd/YefM family antitoxin [Arsenicitalea aurantiaca]|uniref:Antitoxin n=1 Tax=Arsenicitalea aurantiaca TaxID=1783274 RepID=A0A433XAA7_9HYPH|nr:type II toxin-antitoxin system Phd/YefM family antitoxin [Arsenicitalea aurantiaca]RUT31005.1 type II toxin-antitoxin system Phd/YefM family antitoxin [Arsenicitalea aurantiaca]
MPETVITARAFNQDTSAAKRAAEAGPVVITDRGRPTHVLLTEAEYRRLRGRPQSLLDALAQPGGPDTDFDIELPARTVEPVGADIEP